MSGALHRPRAALAVALVLALPACTMGPDYMRPAVDTPAAFRVPPTSLPPDPPSSLPKVDVTIASTPALATRWWKAFGDPVLDALVDDALAHNQNLAVAAANVDAAAAILTQTRSSLFPQVGYSGSAERQRVPETGLAAIIPNYPNPQNAYQALLTASWEIDLWGRIRRLSEASLANLLATDAARDGVVMTVVCGVVQNYLALRGLDQQLAVAQRTLGTYAESVKLFELQFKYGQISQMNVAQVHSQYETAAAQIPQIETSIAQTENALSVLTGRNPTSIPRGKTIAELTAPGIPAELPSSLLAQRPDLVQAEQQLVAANAQIGAAKALYFPTISLTGALGSSSGALHDLFTGPMRVWSFAGQFTGPIFTAGAVSGQVAQAEAQRNAALANYTLSIQNAFADVDNSLVAYDRLREQWAAQTRLVAALAEYSRLAKLQYDAGYVPYSTVLQAEQSLFPAELNLAAIRTSMLNSSVNVYKAMGGGWVTAAAAQAPSPSTGR